MIEKTEMCNLSFMHIGCIIATKSLESRYSLVNHRKKLQATIYKQTNFRPANCTAHAQQALQVDDPGIFVSETN